MATTPTPIRLFAQPPPLNPTASNPVEWIQVPYEAEGRAYLLISGDQSAQGAGFHVYRVDADLNPLTGAPIPLRGPTGTVLRLPDPGHYVVERLHSSQRASVEYYDGLGATTSTPTPAATPAISPYQTWQGCASLTLDKPGSEIQTADTLKGRISASSLFDQPIPATSLKLYPMEVNAPLAESGNNTSSSSSELQLKSLTLYNTGSTSDTTPMDIILIRRHTFNIGSVTNPAAGEAYSELARIPPGGSYTTSFNETQPAPSSVFGYRPIMLDFSIVPVTEPQVTPRKLVVYFDALYVKH